MKIKWWHRLVEHWKQKNKERKEWAKTMKKMNWRQRQRYKYEEELLTREEWKTELKKTISERLHTPQPETGPPIIEVASSYPDNSWDTFALLLYYMSKDLDLWWKSVKCRILHLRTRISQYIDPYFGVGVEVDPEMYLALGGLLNATSTMLRANMSDILPLRIGLAQSNIELAAGYLLNVSDPKSVNFGKHWSAQQVIETFAPSDEGIKEVVKWLGDSGIDSERLGLSPGLNWVTVDATVEEAENLLNTTYYQYLFPDKSSRIGSEEYFLPDRVKNYIDIIIPTTPYEGVQPVPQQVVGPATTHLDGLSGLDTCQYLITIECLRHLYKFGPANSSIPDYEIGIVQWGDSLGAQADLDSFFNNFTTPSIPASTAPELVSIHGDSSGGGGKPMPEELKQFLSSESALDVQTAYSIVYPQNVRLYQVGNDMSESAASNFDAFLDSIDAGAPLSNVLSFSYLQTEANLPLEYQRRQCLEWLKLGLQGVSVLFASGDNGVGNRDPITGEATCLEDGKRFSPSFPANCPWVTTVGATSLRSKGISNGEVALEIPDPFDPREYISSGGGFSSVFSRPAYQYGAVSSYLEKYPPPYNNSVYNPSGRGFPDISALGHNITFFHNGAVQRGGGTSASTPLVASLVTLLNEERSRVGKRPLGFLNPILYEHPDAFNDIVEGSNPGCGTDGFKAAPGWDPVTGLGTPNYEKLREIVLELP